MKNAFYTFKCGVKIQIILNPSKKYRFIRLFIMSKKKKLNSKVIHPSLHSEYEKKMF